MFLYLRRQKTYVQKYKKTLIRKMTQRNGKISHAIELERINIAKMVILQKNLQI